MGLVFYFSRGLTEALGRTDENTTDSSGVDLARIGLGAPPRSLLVGPTPRPSGAGLDGGEGYFLFLVFISALFLFLVLLILLAILGAFDSIISGWADVLEVIYNDIGGCSSYIFYFLTFCLTFLTLNLLLGRLRHHLKKVDDFKMLWMNLEQQCVVCFFFHFLSCYSTFLMADARFGRVTIFRRPSKSVAHGRWLTVIWPSRP